MSSLATKYIISFRKNCCCFQAVYSFTFARAISTKFLKLPCQMKMHYPSSRFSNISLHRMSGDFTQKRFSHYKAAVLKEFGEKLEIVDQKRLNKIKDTQVPNLRFS